MTLEMTRTCPSNPDEARSWSPIYSGNSGIGTDGDKDRGRKKDKKKLSVGEADFFYTPS